MAVRTYEESIEAMPNPEKGWRALPNFVLTPPLNVLAPPDLWEQVHCDTITWAKVNPGAGPSLGGSSVGYDWTALNDALALYPDRHFVVGFNGLGRPDRFGDHPFPYWLRVILRDDASGGPTDMGAGFYTAINQPTALSALAGTVLAGATSIKLDGNAVAAGWPSLGYGDLDGEYFSYTGIGTTTIVNDTLLGVGGAPTGGAWGARPVLHDHPTGMPIATGDGQWEPNYEAIRTGDSEPAMLLMVQDLCNAFADEYAVNDDWQRQISGLIASWFGESGEYISSMTFQRNRVGINVGNMGAFTPAPTALDPFVFTVGEFIATQLDSTLSGTLSPPTILHDDFGRTVSHQWMPPRTEDGIVDRDPIEGGGWSDPTAVIDPAVDVDLSVDGSSGLISFHATSPGSKRVSSNALGDADDVDLLVKWKINKTPDSTNPANIDFFGRRRYDPYTLANAEGANDNASYAGRLILKTVSGVARVRHKASHELAGSTTGVAGAVETTVAEINPLKSDADTGAPHWYLTRVQIEGHGTTAIRMRSWPAVTNDDSNVTAADLAAEPGTWTPATPDTDSSAVLQTAVGDRRYIITRGYVDAMLSAFGDPPAPRCIMNALGSLNQGQGTRIDERDNLAVAYAIADHGFDMYRRNFGGSHAYLPDHEPPDEAAFCDAHVDERIFYGEAGTRGFLWTTGHKRTGERPTYQYIDDLLARLVLSSEWWAAQETITASKIPPILPPEEVPGAAAGVGRLRTTGDFVEGSNIVTVADPTGFTPGSYVSAEDEDTGEWMALGGTTFSGCEFTENSNVVERPAGGLLAAGVVVGMVLQRGSERTYVINKVHDKSVTLADSYEGDTGTDDGEFQLRYASIRSVAGNEVTLEHSGNAVAAVVNGTAIQGTGDAASYVTGSFTPASGDLLVIAVSVTGSTASDWAVTDSLGGTWTKIRREVKNGSADILEVWVRDSLTSGAAMTVTYSHPSGNATGCARRVLRVSGMTKTGAAAVRSQGGESNQAAGLPAPTLSQDPLGTNPIISAVLNGTNPSGMTAPTGWSAYTDVGYATPTTGFHPVSLNSGTVIPTVPWGSLSASDFCSVVIELDATDPVDAPASRDASGIAVTRFTSPTATYVDHPFDKLYPGSELSLTDYFQVHSGYRFYVSQIEYGGAIWEGLTLPVTLTVYQRAVAKLYRHYGIRARLVGATTIDLGIDDAAFDAETWPVGPGGPYLVEADFTVPSLPEGTFELQVAIVGDDGEPAMNLAVVT